MFSGAESVYWNDWLEQKLQSFDELPKNLQIQIAAVQLRTTRYLGTQQLLSTMNVLASHPHDNGFKREQELIGKWWWLREANHKFPRG